MQMSGDLGKYGHLSDLLELAEPHFNAEIHGLGVGNNLIKAHLDLGQIEGARRILNELYALKRPDWRPTLTFWDTEIAKTRINSTPVDQMKPMSVTMLCTEGPVWLKSNSPAVELFSLKPQDSIGVCFLGSSADLSSPSSEIRLQMADSPGRLSRALPFFLAEQVAFKSRSSVQTLTPWIAEKPGGFVFSGKAWRDEDATNYARQSQGKSDYVIVSHLRTQAEPWSAELRLIETKDGKLIGNLVALFPSSKPEEAIPTLATQLISVLVREGHIETQAPPLLYKVPLGTDFGTYLLRLEQLLAVRVAGVDGTGPNFLKGERAIIAGNLELCVAYPDNVVTRILLAQTVIAMKKVSPDVVAEFKDKLELLQRERPVPEVANSVVQRMFEQALAS